MLTKITPLHVRLTILQHVLGIMQPLRCNDVPKPCAQNPTKYKSKC